MKIGIAGCTGRVGMLLVQELKSKQWKGLTLAGGTTERGSRMKADFFVTDKAEELFRKADVVIDFTAPSATRKHIRLAAEHKKTLIIGTTGLNAKDKKDMKAAARKTRIIYAANMSVGVNLLLALVQDAASRLGPEWDIEIFEAHHKNKKDSPSGTALALGEAARSGRKRGAFAKVNRSGKRKAGDIGFSVERGGDVVGDHSVTFYGAGEKIELSHLATNRALFAKGALRAAKWSKGKKPGLYSMRDVLGI
jgi:4-hydroxy-tetrahydrodipicolinate reductase